MNKYMNEWNWYFLVKYTTNESHFDLFVQVHPGENVSESGSKCIIARAEIVGVKEMYSCMGVISVQMIFEGIFVDHRAKRSCIVESEKQLAKYGTLGYTTGKSRECRDGIIDWNCLRVCEEILNFKR